MWVLTELCALILFLGGCSQFRNHCHAVHVFQWLLSMATPIVPDISVEIYTINHGVLCGVSSEKWWGGLWPVLSTELFNHSYNQHISLGLHQCYPTNIHSALNAPASLRQSERCINAAKYFFKREKNTLMLNVQLGSSHTGTVWYIEL